MRRHNIRFITHASMIAALYVALTLFANLFGLASSGIQIRLSEALTILPFFTTAAIPGLTVGCIISNLLTGCMPLDVLFGSFATFLGAAGTYFLRKHRFAAIIPPITANTLIVPWVLAYVYQFEGSIWYFILTVGIGEVISCGILGMVLFSVLRKYQNVLFS